MEKSPLPLPRRLTAEALGTFFLLTTVVGSGIMAERLFPDSAGLALLANSLATGATLAACILSLAPISGAHFNPAVSMTAWLEGALAGRELAAFVAAQIGGAAAGVLAANVMFDLPLVTVSQHARGGAGQLLGEIVATFGLILVIRCCARRRSSETVAVAVAAYIVAAYWFTSSTSFANPAVTIARSLSDSFAGIAPASVAPFVVVQLVGAAAAAFVSDWLVPAAGEARDAAKAGVVLPSEVRR